jgi:hypothetical protein
LNNIIILVIIRNLLIVTFLDNDNLEYDGALKTAWEKTSIAWQENTDVAQNV